MLFMPAEVWDAIACKIYLSEDAKTLRAMSLASRGLRDAATPWLYRDIVLDRFLPYKLRSLRTLIKTGHAKEIHNVMFLQDHTTCSTTIHLFLKYLLPALSMVRRFVWRSAVPINHHFLQILMNARCVSQMDLFLKIDASLNPPWAPVRAEINKKLDTLEFEILWLGHGGGNPNIGNCQEIILKAPKLRSLSITMKYGMPHISAAMEACPKTAFNFALRDVLPAFEKLSLKHLPVGISGQHGLEHKINIAALRHLVVEKPASGNLEKFLGNLMARGQICLTKLVLNEDLPSDTVRSDTWPTVLDRFLSSFARLQELALPGGAAVALHVIENGVHCHGKTLRSLKIHDANEVKRLENCPFRGAQFSHLERIRTALPLLEYLELDLPLGCTNNMICDIKMMRFPRLRTFTLYTPLLRATKRAFEPCLDQSYIQHLATHVNSPLLKEVTVFAGQLADQSVPEEGYTMDYHWESYHRMVWHMRYSLVNDTNVLVSVAETEHTKLKAELEENFGKPGLDYWKFYLKYVAGILGPMDTIEGV